VLLDPAAPNGYERVWRPAMQFGPERHLGYAIQWFALALVALIIFIALSLRRLPGAALAPTDSTSGSP
jgi:surfeit locus 1 family protein